MDYLIVFFILQQFLLTPDMLLIAIAPIITWLASMLANWIKSKVLGVGFGGLVMISTVVPLMAILSAYISSLIIPSLGFWILFGLSFSGVFINRFIVEFTQTSRQEQTNVLPTLTTLPTIPPAL